MNFGDKTQYKEQFHTSKNNGSNRLMIEKVIVDKFLSMSKISVGKVVAVYPDTQTVDVQLYGARIHDGDFVDLPIIPNIPFIFPKFGNMHISYPVRIGDNATVYSADYDIHNFLSKNTRTVDTERMNDLSDSFAIIGFSTDIDKVASYNPNAIEIVSGDKKFTFLPTGIETNFSLRVDGNIEVTGDVKAGAISLKTHTHDPGSFVTAAANGAGGPVTGKSASPT